MSYHIRKSHFSLVELSILAHAFEKDRVPKANNQSSSELNYTQTMLAMKAAESTGQLFVAIHDSDPVGFIWRSEQTITWVREDHRNKGLESMLKAHAQEQML